MNKQDLQQFEGHFCYLVKSDGWKLKGMITKVTDESIHIQSIDSLRVISLHEIIEVKLSINQNEPNNFHQTDY